MVLAGLRRYRDLVVARDPLVPLQKLSHLALLRLEGLRPAQHRKSLVVSHEQHLHSPHRNVSASYVRRYCTIGRRLSTPLTRANQGAAQKYLIEFDLMIAIKRPSRRGNSTAGLSLATRTWGRFGPIEPRFDMMSAGLTAHDRLYGIVLTMVSS